jgi:ABC-2 type transport system ATP-binding protein
LRDRIDIAVQARDLIKRFGSVVAVDGVSLDIRKGEILGLLGPNGAGKTTVIQMLLNLVTPTSGSIHILGMDIRRYHQKILQQVNFSSTYVSLPYSLTILENLTVFARLYGVSNRREKIAGLLRMFELEGMEKRLTGSLSSGQLTRVYLAKALLNSPKILFLDEPTASLDPDIADKTRRLLLDIRRDSGLTILYTSHNMKEMEEISDRILFLHKGKVISSGTPRDVLEDFKESNLEDVFIKVARGEERTRR